MGGRALHRAAVLSVASLPPESSTLTLELSPKDGANDVYSSLQIYRFLLDLAQPGVDVLALASNNVSTASSWKPPQAALGIKPPPRAFPSDESDVEKPKPRRSGAGGRPTPRQTEAYKLWHLEGLSLDEASSIMSTSRPIKPISVMHAVRFAEQ